MYIDSGDSGDSGELKIDVDGHEYTEQENFSTGSDGVLDSYEVDTAGGDHLVYTDTDHDGHADEVTELDAQGDVTRQAHFDPGSGHWLPAGGAGSGNDPGNTGDPQTDTGHSGGAETITVDTPNGEVNLGPATVDSNNDGTPDTVVVHDAAGDTILYTDANHDGSADVATEITADGHVTTAEHTGDHQWADVQTGHLDGQGDYHSDGTATGEFDPQVGTAASAAPAGQPGGSGLTGGGAPATDPAGDDQWTRLVDGLHRDSAASGSVVRIDSGTGQWISQN